MMACCISAGGEDTVQVLLDAGAAASGADQVCTTAAGLGGPLHTHTHAAGPRPSQPSTANPATTDAPQQAGNAPLHLAAISGNQQLVRLLLSAPSGGTGLARAANSRGRTPLHLAAAFGHAAAARELLPQSDACATDEDGTAPLHVAAKSVMFASAAEQAGLVRAIIDAGGDPAAKDDAGRTPGDFLATGSALQELLPARSAGDCGTAGPSGSTGGSGGSAEPAEAARPQDRKSASKRQMVRRVGWPSWLCPPGYAWPECLKGSATGAAAAARGAVAATHHRLAHVMAGPHCPHSTRPAAPQVEFQLQQGLTAAGAAAAAALPAAGGSGGGSAEAFLVKEALRTHTSDEAGGWKLAAGVDMQ